MTRSVVVDASVLVAALTQLGRSAEQASRLVTDSELVGPALLPFEVANVIRRHVLAGLLSEPQGATALAVLRALRIDLHPFPPLAEGVWMRRANLTAYDASYAALADLLGLPLVTLDRRLSRAPGLACEVVVLA